MRKRVKNNVYDTTTAKKIACKRTSEHKLDLTYTEEDLYRKRTGEYFLDCFSSPYGKYGLKEQQTDTHHHVITPLSFNDAKDWYKDANTYSQEDAPNDIYEQEFGDTNNFSNKKHAKIYHLTENAIAKIARIAKEQGISQSDVINNFFGHE